MATKSGDREAYFPAIEKKHGEKITYWIKELKGLGDAKYPEQIAFLRENYGFSQAHANALVMFVRGSTTSKRHSTVDEYLRTLSEPQRTTIKKIIQTLQKKRPSLELVMAWNKPMFKHKDQYVFGMDAASKHILIAPFNSKVIAQFEDRLEGYTVLKKTIRVPADWKVNASLLNDMVGACIKALEK